MKIARRIVAVVATVALAVTFVGAGFLVCIAPPVTHVLSSFFSDDVTSPFTRTQLTQVADATRDYSFGGHDELALYQAIYEVDLQLRQDITLANGDLPYAFPELDRVRDRENLGQYKWAFDGASELYCYSPQTISHLDDCYNVARTAYALLALCAITAVGCLVACGVMGRKRLVGNVLLAAGAVVVVAFVALGVWAAVNFEGFFATFHQLFFSQGNWTFPYDSLLICALPTEFWMGMGVVWLGVAFIVSILSIVIGSKLRK